MGRKSSVHRKDNVFTITSRRTSSESLHGVVNTSYQLDREETSSTPSNPPSPVCASDSDCVRRLSSGNRLSLNNPIFITDEALIGTKATALPSPPIITQSKTVASVEDGKAEHERATWGNPVEFLMSCISMSVGLGNIWRFPYTAYSNGGGAFLIPYLIVLAFIGKPLYFMEMAMGQFCSFGSVKVWKMAPILKGVGYGQAMSVWFISTYYTVLIAITIFYLVASFQTVLPWTVCNPDWISASLCYNSTANISLTNATGLRSSSSLYFTEEVVKKWDTIDDGIGLPDWRLALCLLSAWLCVCLILMKGVAASGKVAYFTALFPYTILFTLLVRGVTLPGAIDGIIYFIRPDWSKLLDPQTWYAAVVQCFFSLAVGSGPIIMFSSYNPFKHNIYRDGLIISLMDTFTSMLAGFTIFSVLGNLAHETGQKVGDVASGGPGLAFISYPDAIAKFTVVPQLFAVLFFLMLLTLGIGSAVSLTGGIITIVCDAFPKNRRWVVTAVVCLCGFLFGLVYTTPGGLFVLDIVDYFGGGFIIFIMAVVETIGICWIYGLNRFIKDVEFMLNIQLGIYWKVTWAYVTPLTLLSIFFYSLTSYAPLKEGDYYYPTAATCVGWLLTSAALLQIPIWAAVAVYQQKKTGASWYQRFLHSCQPAEDWGPKNASDRRDWNEFQQSINTDSPRYWLPRIPSKNKFTPGPTPKHI